MSDWNIPQNYLDQSREIERLTARNALLEKVADVARIIIECGCSPNEVEDLAQYLVALSKLEPVNNEGGKS